MISIISALALIISALTFFYPRLKKGSVEMTRPASIFLQSAGGLHGSQVVLAALIHGTADRGRYIENMFIRLSREGGVQIFTDCRYEEGGALRPAAFFANRQGLASCFRFSSPGYGAWYDFLPGDYTLRVFIKSGSEEELMIREERFTVTSELFRQMNEEHTGMWFIWSPDSGRYVGHVGQKG